MIAFLSIFERLFRSIRAYIVNYLLRRATRYGKQRLGGGVFRLTSGLVIKKGPPNLLLIEAEAIEFVASQTSIPLSRVRYYYAEGEVGNLVLNYVEGQTFQRAWRNLSDAQRLSVMRRLAGFVDQLRAIPQPLPPAGSSLPPQGWIGSPLGRAFADFYATQDAGVFGPFANEREFYDWRALQFKPFGDRHAPTAARIAEIRHSMPDDHPIVFTHGDINRRNVLVRIHGDGPDDVEVTALLDWEQAGWRPIYWESRKWMFMGSSTPGWGEFGRDEIGSGYKTEIELDRELQAISGHIP